MPGREERLEEVLGFIRQHRNNESNFETLYTKLEGECAVVNSNETRNKESYLARLNK